MTHLTCWTIVGTALLGAAGTGCSTASGLAADAAPSAAVDAAERRLIGLELAPVVLTLGVGDLQPLAVTGVFDDGARELLTSGVTWASSAPAVATVSAGGVVAALAAGATTITASVAALSVEVEVDVTGPALRVYRDDYGDGVSFAPFGGSTGGPSVVGVDPHAGTTSLRLEVPGAGYTGGAFRIATPTDLSAFAAVTFWARASKTAALNVVGIGNDASTTTHWAEWNAVPLTTTWTRYVLPVPLPARLTAEHGLFHVAQGSEEGAYTIWLDDIQYENPGPGVIGPPSPAIATETVGAVIGSTVIVHGAAVTYAVGGGTQTIASARRYFTFQSSQPAVATVDDDGLVTALATGTAVITARLGTVDAIGALTVNVHP